MSSTIGCGFFGILSLFACILGNLELYMRCIPFVSENDSYYAQHALKEKKERNKSDAGDAKPGLAPV